MRPAPQLIDVCWAVPFLTACASFLFSMLKTNGGILFLLYIDHFGVSREAATWPKAVQSAATNIMGFAIGAAQQRLSVYSIIAGGAVLCPVAIIASAFAPDMIWMSVAMGFLYGMSSGLLMIGMSIYIVSYFETHKNTAAGIKFLGASLNGVVGPSLLSHLASTYGVQGCLLVSGALMLNLIPLTLMLRKPRPLTWSHLCCLKSLSKNKASVAINNATTLDSSQDPYNDAIEPSQDDKHGISRNTGRQATKVRATREKDDPYRHPAPPPSFPQCPQQPSLFDQGDDKNGLGAQVLFVLTRPCFYVILVAMVAGDFIIPILGSTIVDYGRDKRLSPEDSSQLLTWLCLGALCGYLLIPLVSDRYSRKRCLTAAFSFILLSVCCVFMPHVYGFAATAAVTFVSGTQQGYLSTLKPVLVAEYLGVHSVAASWGLMGVASLPLTFCEPSIVGVFRDGEGSYDRLYLLCGVVNLLAALALSLQTCFDARKRSAALQTTQNDRRHESTPQPLARY